MKREVDLRFCDGSAREWFELRAEILQKLYPKDFDTDKLVGLLGNAETVRQIKDGVSPDEIVSSWSDALRSFDQVRRKYYLYK